MPVNKKMEEPIKTLPIKKKGKQYLKLRIIVGFINMYYTIYIFQCQIFYRRTSSFIIESSPR
jgi:hypothetical protein